MAKYVTEIKVPVPQLEDAEKHLRGSYGFDGGEDLVYCWTGVFKNGFEVDVKVVDAARSDGGPWSEAVLFDEDGYEMACTEVSDSVTGEWVFFFRDDEYVALVSGG